METLGNKLKTAREEKFLTIDYISRETNISSRYLEALENEDFSVFPSESYVLGFLGNYGDYLGLDQEELLSLYRSLKIQDQPVPMEELLRGPSKLPKILGITAIILGALLVLGAAVYLIVSNIPGADISPPTVERQPAEYMLRGDVLERRFYTGDSILVSGESDQYRLVFMGIGDAVSISTPRGSLMLDLGQEVIVDISDYGFVRLRIFAIDFVRHDNAFGALLRFEQEIIPQIVPVEPEDPMEISIPRNGATVIFNSPNAMPFTLQAHFQNYCLFRYEILFEPARAGRNEAYYQRSQELSITAQNGVRLGISNAQAVRLQAIIGGRVFSFEAGGAGEVVAADLRWVRDEDNSFSLVLIRLE